MARTVGTCPRCRRERPLDDGRHLSEHERLPGSEHAWRCNGSGQLCTEASADNLAKSRARTMVRLDQLRADATVAHDAIATGYPWPAHQVLALCKAALQEYRLKHPEKPRRQRLWFFLNRSTRGERRFWGVHRADVYCTLCRELLLQNVVRGINFTEARTVEHTTLCALRRLAGMEPYVAPGERRLPADAVQSAEVF